MTEHRKSSPIALFKAQVQTIQRNARCPLDISNWMQEHASLLREVSLEMGFSGPDDAYALPAEIQLFEIAEFEGVTIASNGKSDFASMPMYFKVQADCTWETDKTMHLTKIIAEIPELGIELSRNSDYSLPAFSSIRTLNFLPTHWPIAAAATLLMVTAQRDKCAPHLERMLASSFPSTKLEDFTTFYEAGLVTDDAMLCEWLIQRELTRAATVLPSGLEF